MPVNDGVLDRVASNTPCVGVPLDGAAWAARCSICLDEETI